MDSRIIGIFKSINFIERYEFLSKKHQFDLKESFEGYDREVVLKLFNELGYEISFNKKENFFGMVEKTTEYELQFKISLKYVMGEFIWLAWKNSEQLVGGTWGIIKEQLDGKENDKIKKPIFRNYDDLKEILSEAFLMYEDFKNEIIVL
ncbi:hypothetical protein AMQ83_08655 [Paenibacillus riograndensis]|nr:hypothetical protein AMQ83_08655 [Paenibacillus riograndensis]